MNLRNFLAHIRRWPRSGRIASPSDADGRQGRAGACRLDNGLPHRRPVADEVDASFKNAYAAPASGLPRRGKAPPGSAWRTDMRAPKILPWIARKAGISDVLALKLWRRAAGETEELCGCCDSAEYHAAVVRRFLDLVEDESEAISCDPTADSATQWIWRHERRMTQLNMLAAQEMCRLWQASWCAFLPAQMPPTLRLR